MSNDDLIPVAQEDELEEGADLDAAILDDDMLPEEVVADDEEPFVAEDEEDDDTIIEDSYDDVSDF